ncbi:MAG: MATE family efflux transporter [Eubacteriales bacterium]|nr:MATE family efflux transporter [Eubacteriales bacterium]
MRPTAAQNRTVNMTSGNPVNQILRFGLPLIAANTLQQLYAMVDTIILGRFGGIAGLAVLGTSSWPVWLCVSILTNFAQASSIVIAKRFGAGLQDELKTVAGNVYAVALGLCAAMMVFSQLLARPMLVAQNTPPDVLEQAVLYLRIVFGGIALLFAYNIHSAFLRAVGDSKTPLYAIAAATAVNIALDLLFVAGFHWGAPGAALATVIAQGASAAVCLLRVRAYEIFRLERRHFRLCLPVLREYFALCLPMLMQSFVIALGGSFVQTHVNGYGTAFTAGISATGRVFGLLETAAIALAQSAATFVSQNFGAGNLSRVHRGVKISIRFALGIATVLAVAMFLCGKWLLGLFVAPEAIETSAEMLVVYSFGLWIMYPMYVLRQTLQALGNAAIPLLAAVIQLLARVLVTLYLPLWLGQRGLYFPTIAAWLSSLLLIGLVYPRQLRKCERITAGRPGANPGGRPTLEGASN